MGLVEDANKICQNRYRRVHINLSEEWTPRKESWPMLFITTASFSRSPSIESVPVLGGVKHSELPEEELAAGVKRRENHLGPKAGSGEVELMEILTPLTSAYHFIANDYCKNDILNNELFWLLCLLCQCQIPLESMRRFAAGVLVAFLKSTVKENGETF
ncbi:hypothetical protein SUGI_0439890 [Cryptomeria japonica]|nr:hypothetical protein SUGI_0439890 [Cryptomeria japonica]